MVRPALSHACNLGWDTRADTASQPPASWSGSSRGFGRKVKGEGRSTPGPGVVARGTGSGSLLPRSELRPVHTPGGGRGFSLSLGRAAPSPSQEGSFQGGAGLRWFLQSFQQPCPSHPAIVRANAVPQVTPTLRQAHSCYLDSPGDVSPPAHSGVPHRCPPNRTQLQVHQPFC